MLDVNMGSIELIIFFTRRVSIELSISFQVQKMLYGDLGTQVLHPYQ